jgi:uncharacterized phage-like protein YoqJ
MNNKETHLEVNDYLDLYLFAESLGDKLWQNEIIEKLQNNHKDLSQHGPSLTLQTLRKEYQKISIDILELYSQFQEKPFNEELQEKTWDLKQQRIELSLKIHIEERKSQRHKH